MRAAAALATLLLCLCAGLRAAAGPGDGAKPQLIVQLGHSQNLTALAVSRDGRLAVTGGEDNAAILWDMETGRELRRLVGHAAKVTSVAVSADKQVVVTGSADKSAIVWDAAAGRARRRLASPAGPVEAVAVSPDGTLVAMGFGIDFDRSIFSAPTAYGIVWDAGTGREVARLKAGSGVATSVAFTPDGRRVLMGTLDNDAVLWDMATGEEVRRLKGHTAPIMSVAVSPDGRLALTGSRDGTAAVWGLGTGRLLRRLVGHNGNVLSVAFSPDGSRAATGGGYPDDTVRLWDTSSGAELKRQAARAQVFGVAFAAGGTKALLVRGAGASLWDFEADKVAWRFLEGNQGAVGAVGFSPDGRFIKVEQFGDVYLWDTAANLRPWRFENSHADGVLFTPKGGLMLEQNVNDARLWDTLRQKMIRVLRGEEVNLYSGKPLELNTNPIAISPDGSLAVTGGFKNVLVVWDLATGREVRRLTGHKKDIYIASFSADGKLLVSTSADQTARVWEVGSWKQLRQFPLAAGFGQPAWLSPEGHYALVTDSSESVTLWDVKTGRQEARFAALSNNGGRAAFSPDGRYVLAGPEAGSTDLRWRLWGLAPRREVRNFADRRPVAFSPDGLEVVTVDPNFVAHVEETETGKELVRLEGHRGAVNSAAYSPDGRFLLTGGYDGTARVWLKATGEEVCRLVSFKDGDWVAVAPDGRFDTNNLDQITSLHWTLPAAPFTPLSLELFMRDYYEPRLLPRLFKCAGIGDCGEFKPVRDLSALNRARPAVSITSVTPAPDRPESVSVTVEVSDATSESQLDAGGRPLRSGVYDVRLFRDRQLVGYGPREGGRVALDASGRATLDFDVRLPRIGVKQVEFSAYAFNSDRLKSDTARRTYAPPSPLKSAGRTVYVICVGVNTNEQPRWNLRYAANDARLTQEVLGQKLRELQTFGVYKDVVTVALVSDGETKDATKQNIHAVLDLLAGRPVDEGVRRRIDEAGRLRRAQPDDAVIISFSGHGYADADGVFYLVPYDTGPGADGGLESILAHCISSDELSEWLKDVDAGEMTLIIDACHSAASVEGRQFKPGPMGSRGLGQLSYDKGMRILAATQADNLALEAGETGQGRKIEQGLLTYALVVDGIQHKSADALPEPDGEITLGEWLAYGVLRVPELYEEASAGKRSLLEGGKPADGARTAESLGKDRKRGAGIQQPALFDFARRRADLELVNLRTY